MLGVARSSLKMVKFEPTIPNMSQHGGQTHTTCCAQQCCDILRWNVEIASLGLKTKYTFRFFFNFVGQLLSLPLNKLYLGNVSHCSFLIVLNFVVILGDAAAVNRDEAKSQTER